MPGLSQIASNLFNPKAMAGLMGAGAVTQSEDTEAMLAGKLAKKADKFMLSIAQKMKSLDMPEDEIFQKTNWFLDPEDGNWKFEIPDINAKIKTISGTADSAGDEISNISPFISNLEDSLLQSDVYANYPELKKYTLSDIPLRESREGLRGSFDKSRKHIRLASNRPNADIRSTGLHETQHAIQDIEGWQSGASPDWFSRAPLEKAKAKYSASNSRYKSQLKAVETYRIALKRNPDDPTARRLFDKFRDEAIKTRKKLLDVEEEISSLNPHAIYESVLGEVDARNIQTRDNMRRANISEKDMRSRTPRASRSHGREGSESILPDPATHEAYKWRHEPGVTNPASMADIAKKAGFPFKNNASQYANQTLGSVVDFAKGNKKLIGGPLELFYPEGVVNWLDKMARGKKVNWQDRVDIGMDFL
ncbi:MAG: hypothetical protein DRP42_04390 [Tenericutes bacterium]|nr:MAG: hypothetical protein DRP42_04390 [Mycoplasmatota bacterium]